MTLTQFLMALKARWRIAAGVFLGIVLLTILISLLMPKMYTASATVVADTKPDPLSAAAGLGGLTSTAYIATQVDIISSARVAERAVRILKLDKSPEWIADWRESTGGEGDIVVWIGSILQKALIVAPTRDSSVIEIAVTWGNPKTAALFANAFAQAYMDINIELKVEPAKQYAAYFDERAKALRADLEAKQKRLADFQAQNGILVVSDSRLDIENARLSELSTQLVAIQGVRQESESRQHQADAESMPEVLQSPFIQGLKSDLSKAEAKLQDIAQNVGKNHPDYQTTAKEIADLRERVREESIKIASSLGNTTQINVRRESEIRGALEAQKKRMLELTQKQDQVVVLQNDVATSQRNLDAVTTRLAQSSLESQTQQTTISLLTTAVEPMKKSSPRFMLNLLVGMFLGATLGLAAAIGRELMDRRVRHAADLTGLHGVPLFGRIPGIKPERDSPRANPGVSTRVEPAAI